MTAAEKPDTCGGCVQFCDPPRPYNERGDRETCSPRGTHWHLMRRAEQAACSTIHARKRDTDAPDQGALL